MSVVYKVKNLEDARDLLSSAQGEYILTNSESSVKYYGMLVVDHMFEALQQEFPKKVIDVIVNVGDDHAALFTAIKLNYKNIVYTGHSEEAKKQLYLSSRDLIAGPVIKDPVVKPRGDIK
ncbi:MAG TPA: hypothetical protein LFW14_02440 [Rickettsia endosymbiont of Degeeriella rufa]|nr:hypothetical protein [Rickettsia endosymbiont of Degeeriella rufa]